jgi:hypothetical protein
MFIVMQMVIWLRECVWTMAGLIKLTWPSQIGLRLGEAAHLLHIE